MASAWRVSGAKPKCSPGSIIRTSRPFTVWRATAPRPSSWSWSRGGRWRIASRRGPIPVDDALPIAKQIAEAVEAAHDQGIIHRDLKPAHVKVREDGPVKGRDFGLAKALDPVAGGSTDATAAPTAAKIRAEADAKLVAGKVPALDQVRSLDLARSASREVLRSYPIAPVTF